ncbi:germination protein, Ger(x)C family [Evansella caseinilytica]|uniref:Germination protein, Ger(X)C family n=1 Tax=Evansella caseinilytica TaxID=1503961 RepID=A0A1H3U760_9BACI|nr:hypothetical protein [Evansella caseinilytica]SDZ58260.1 germination protein, Ger(x)C family [Evansella caseinilytica]
MMKLWKWLFFFTLLTAAAGCQLDSREIDHRTMVLGMAIDKTEEGEFIVTVQVPVIVPTEGQLGPSEFETLTQTGATVWEAISNIEAMTPTVLFFGHLKTVMFGETLAREGIGQVLDMLDRRAPLANQVLLLIIRNRIEADKFLSQESPLVNLPALYIERFFKADQKLSRSTDVKLFQYRRDSNLKGNAGLIPLAYSDRENIFIEDMAVFIKESLLAN